MTLHPDRSSQSRRPRATVDPLGEFELEARLAQLERRYAEASMRFRRARDEYHLVCLQPAGLEGEVATARERHEASRRQCEALRRDIEEIESRLA